MEKTGQEFTTSPPEAYHKPPPSYGFVNPAALNTTSRPPPPAYQYGQVAPPPVVYTQPIGVVSGFSVMSPEIAGINDYMAWSIFNILCCGLLLGFIGVLFSSQVRDRKMAGDVEGARRLSTWTAVWNAFTTLAGIGIIIGIVVYATTSVRYYHY